MANHVQPAMRPASAEFFDIAPSPFCLRDFGAARTAIEAWRAAGIVDLRAFLEEDPDRARPTMRAMRPIRLNAAALALFEARDDRHFSDNLDHVFGDGSLAACIDELAQLWDGSDVVAGTFLAHTLAGRRIEVRSTARILPGCRDDWSLVLVAMEDLTERERTRRELEQGARYANGLFQHSPVSLWVQDFSRVRAMVGQVQESGVRDMQAFIEARPDFVEACFDRIVQVDMNRQMLDLFRAPDPATLLAQTRPGRLRHFRDRLNRLCEGRMFYELESVGHALDGEKLHLLTQFSVLPGHEHDWSLVQIATTNITSRKNAEANLEYLCRHDILTQLRNRTAFVEEMERLEREGVLPVTVIMADLNGLKQVNDRFGHAAGDELLRRAGEILKESFAEPFTAARLGGDEFGVIMPEAAASQGASLAASLREHVAVENSRRSCIPLSLSLGLATTTGGDRMEDVVRRADEAMYAAKRRHYARIG